MHNIILTAVLLILGSASASAQFYTITKEKEILPCADEIDFASLESSLQKAVSGVVDIVAEAIKEVK